MTIKIPPLSLIPATHPLSVHWHAPLNPHPASAVVTFPLPFINHHPVIHYIVLPGQRLRHSSVHIPVLLIYSYGASFGVHLFVLARWRLAGEILNLRVKEELKIYREVPQRGSQRELWMNRPPADGRYRERDGERNGENLVRKIGEESTIWSEYLISRGKRCISARLLGLCDRRKAKRPHNILVFSARGWAFVLRSSTEATQPTVLRADGYRLVARQTSAWLVVLPFIDKVAAHPVEFHQPNWQ